MPGLSSTTIMQRAFDYRRRKDDVVRPPARPLAGVEEQVEDDLAHRDGGYGDSLSAGR